MKTKQWTAAMFGVGALALLTGTPGSAHDMSEHGGHGGHQHSAAAATAPPESVAITLSSKPLIDTRGRSLKLKDDVIGDRIVVVSLVYTTCTTVCPVVSAILADLQVKLGKRIDKEVRLVSLTVDPQRDTPERLKSYAAQFDAQPGWFWLTGSEPNVTAALKGFGAYTANFENHPVIVLIGDGKTGKWSRHYAMTDSAHLLARVDEYLNARRSRHEHAS